MEVLLSILLIVGRQISLLDGDRLTHYQHWFFDKGQLLILKIHKDLKL